MPRRSTSLRSRDKKKGKKVPNLKKKPKTKTIRKRRSLAKDNKGKRIVIKTEKDGDNKDADFLEERKEDGKLFSPDGSEWKPDGKEESDIDISDVELDEVPEVQIDEEPEEDLGKNQKKRKSGRARKSTNARKKNNRKQLMKEIFEQDSLRRMKEITPKMMSYLEDNTGKITAPSLMRYLNREEITFRKHGKDIDFDLELCQVSSQKVKKIKKFFFFLFFLENGKPGRSGHWQDRSIQSRVPGV